MGGALIRRIALMVLVCALPVHAVIGDLNLDGVVDLKDFFILADNFGREGAPEVCEDPDTRRRWRHGTNIGRDWRLGHSRFGLLQYLHLLDWQPR